MSRRGIDVSGVRVYRKRLMSFLRSLLCALLTLIFVGVLLSGKATESAWNATIAAVGTIFFAAFFLMFLADFLRLRPAVVINWKGVAVNLAFATRFIPWFQITKVGETIVPGWPASQNGIELTLRNTKEVVEAWSSASTGLRRACRRLLLRLDNVVVSGASVSFPTRLLTHSREELLKLVEEGLARYGRG
jgi:hypothetical protein